MSDVALRGRWANFCCSYLFTRLCYGHELAWLGTLVLGAMQLLLLWDKVEAEAGIVLTCWPLWVRRRERTRSRVTVDPVSSLHGKVWMSDLICTSSGMLSLSFSCRGLKTQIQFFLPPWTVAGRAWSYRLSLNQSISVKLYITRQQLFLCNRVHLCRRRSESAQTQPLHVLLRELWHMLFFSQHFHEIFPKLRMVLNFRWKICKFFLLFFLTKKLCFSFKMFFFQVPMLWTQRFVFLFILPFLWHISLLHILLLNVAAENNFARKCPNIVFGELELRACRALTEYHVTFTALHSCPTQRSSHASSPLSH